MRPGASERQPWLVPVVLVAVIATAVAGLLARDLYAGAEVPAPQPVLPSAGPVPPSEQPGHRDVRGTQDATRHPLYGVVRPLLQTHYDAINDRDYALWKTTVVADRISSTPEKKWRLDYRSTRDGGMVVYRIDTGPPGTARVMMGFTSVQDIADAPLELPAACVRWRVVIPLVVEGGGWRIDGGATGRTPQHAPC